MPGPRTVLGVVGALVALILALGAVLVMYVAALALNVEEEGLAVPPDLEALYRQASYGSGVPWEALAAWDAVEYHFSLPVPSVGDLFDRRLRNFQEARRSSAEDWCRKNPKNCPPRVPEVTPQEEAQLWKAALAEWRVLRRAHVEQHAQRLMPYLAQLDRSPGEVFRILLGSDQADAAEEIFEGYLLLQSLEEGHDDLLVPPPVLPPDWRPVDGLAWPLVAPISSRYGLRVSPVDGQPRLHAGIDLAVEAGTPTRASKEGRVVRAEYDPTYGQVVVIDHQDGYRSLYAHHSRLFVSTGDWVTQGQTLGLVGSTGKSTGPHLHFEIQFRTAPVDPLLMLS